jgi:TetR/AcrR family transcriptional repressor of nem operon
MARHKEFNREDVLDRAIDAFWARGYEATSVADLVDEMGINRGSLYDTFGDKHGLFLAAIDRYYERTLRCTISYLEAPGPARDGVEMAIRNVVDCAGAEPGRRGCFVTNSAVELAPHCHDTASRVASYYQRLETAFFGALARARDEGDLDATSDPSALARYITCCLQGVLVLSRAGYDRAALDEVVEVVVATLFKRRRTF